MNIDDESQTRGHSSGTWLIAPEGDWTLCLNVTPTSIECQVANACLSPKGEFEYLQIDATDAAGAAVRNRKMLASPP